MSGPSDLARLKETIDTANELFLSEVPEMIDVGGGVMRPTNAKVLADLSVQMSGAQIFTSVALGLASSVPGGYFSVEDPAVDGYLILYKNEAGAALEKKRYPSAVALSSMQALVDYASDPDVVSHSFEDEKRFVIARLLLDGTLDLLGARLQSIGDGLELSGEDGFTSTRLGFSESLINGLVIRPGDFDGIEFVDGNGFVVGKIGPDVVYFGQETEAPVSPTVALLDQQQRTDHIHVVGYGQSLIRGAFSQPAISLSQPYANLMLAGGIKTRPGDSGYVPNAYAPMVENDFGTEGETPVSAICNGVVRRAVSDGELATDWSLIGSSTGRGGRAIEQLMPGASEGYFEKTLQLIKDAHSTSLSMGKSYSVWAYHWVQGESNYSNSPPYTSSPYQYMQYELELFDNMTREIVGITGQRSRPYLFTYQVAAHRLYGLDRMPVALAQWRASRHRPDVVISVPAYICKTGPDKLHLTNESSWLLGEYHSRAMYETMIRRNGKWRPLEPIAVDWVNDHIDIKFHVPCGCLVLDSALAALAPNFGFDIRETGVVVTSLISSVEVFSKDTVRIVLSRAASESAVLVYALGRNGDTAASGPVEGARGNLRDTHGLFDTAVSPLGNIFALHNPCVMFQYDRKTGF
ncbi:hypothetical protein QLG10_03290 [Pseudomonas sp. V98_8]|uniref:hypothetical protein n=1 Tax=Pseudomonas sp. V98_8 TaxID=3044228 RepID=UPI00249DAC2D|nr:hypothetical protein [Pseudomonas sp. V98_8]MDI3391452.1 hypothetical protein [Pseudomonas sp. V98_8]